LLQKEVTRLIGEVKKIITKIQFKLAGDVHIVHITEEHFEPEKITINLGDTVLWINDHSSTAWPAADQHATHALYPELGGCIGSAFDACRELELGEEYAFTFKIAGEWFYHDHISPEREGIVIVKDQ